MSREPLISLDIAAAHFNVTRRTVRKWTQKTNGPRLESYKTGRLVRTSWAAIRTFEEECRKEDSPVTKTENIVTSAVSPTHEESLRRLRARGMKV